MYTISDQDNTALPIQPRGIQQVKTWLQSKAKTVYEFAPPGCVSKINSMYLTLLLVSQSGFKAYNMKNG